MKKGYTAYNLTDTAKADILSRFSPKFHKVVCHHITVNFGVDQSHDLPKEAEISAIGYASSDKIECLIVSVNGSTQREDGGVFHITLSHNEKAKPVDSNSLIKEGFELITPFSIEAIPEFNSF